MSLRIHLAWISAAALTSAALCADMTINTDVKNGDKIAGEHTFSVTVDSESLVTQVEFYVGDSLRDTDSSTPYQFKIDTLLENDGPIQVTFAAYTSDGKSQKKTLNLVVNNEMSKGADYHVKLGQEALAVSKWNDALAHGRVALKIDSKNNNARMVMARANFGKGIMDLAQKYAEDIIASDPGNGAALDLLAGISLDRVFRATMDGAPGMSREEVVSSIKSALDSATTSRMASLNAQVDNFGEVTDANRLQYADLLARTGRYSRIISMFSSHVIKNPEDTAAQNWLIYSQIRAGRFKDAALSMKNYERSGVPDGYGYTLKAVLYQYAGQAQQALDAEREAILNDPESIGIRTAQVYLALRRGDTPTFAKLASDLVASNGAGAIGNYYLGTLYYALGDSTASQEKMRLAFLAEPAMYDLYVERGNQLLAFVAMNNLAESEVTYQRQLARTFLEAGLKVKPDSFEVLTSLCVLNLLENKIDDAIKMGRAAAAAGPEYAPAHYALAAAYQRNRQSDLARTSHAKAEALDSYLKGRPVGGVNDAWSYFYAYGRVPLIALPAVSSGN